MTRSIVPCVLATALLACGAGNQTTLAHADSSAAVPLSPTAARPVKVAEVEGISEYRLENGLRVLLFPDPSQEKVTVNITYFVGSRHEGYGESGMAHLLEHMVFKGTPDHPDIWKMLQDRGAQFNGTTWYDRTNFFETLPASDDNLEFALTMEADRMLNSTISAEHLSKEFSVVRNEFEAGENSPERVLIDRVASAAYLWHNYGKSTIGNRSDIERVPAGALRAFYAKYYRPDNALLVIAGKFEPSNALELVHQRFAPLNSPPGALAGTYTTEPVQDGEREVVLRRAGDTQLVVVAYHGLPGAHEDAPAFDAAVSILTDEPSGPLYKGLVETKLATRVQSVVFPTREPGFALFLAEVPKATNLEKVRDTLVGIVEGFGKGPVDDKAVARYIRRFQKQLEQQWSDSQSTAVNLTEFAAMGDWRLLFINRDRTDEITASAVVRVGAQYFRRANRTVGLYVPTATAERSPLPDQPDIAALARKYKGRDKTIAEGEVFDANFDNIEARTRRSVLDVGMKLALMPKRTRGNTVQGRLTLHYGDENSLVGLSGANKLLGAVMERGAKGYSFQEIRDRLDELGSSMSIEVSDPGVAVVDIESKRDDLLAVLDLVAVVLSSPTYPKAEIELVKRERVNDLMRQLQDPQALAFIALNRKLKPYSSSDVRYVPTVEEEIERIKAVQVADLKRVQAMWGATNAEAAFVGDFDAAALKGKLSEAFSSWKSDAHYARIATAHRQTEASDEVIVTPDKKMAIVLAAKSLKLRDDDPDYPALALAGYVLGSGGSSRLFKRLRQKDGLSYGAFGDVQAGSLDERSTLYGGAILAPDNADKGMAALLQEMTLLFDKGIGEQELADAKAAFIERTATQLASDQHLVSLLSEGLHVGRTLTFDKQLQASIEALTATQVNEAVRRHLSSENLALIKAGALDSVP